MTDEQIALARRAVASTGGWTTSSPNTWVVRPTLSPTSPTPPRWAACSRWCGRRGPMSARACCPWTTAQAACGGCVGSQVTDERSRNGTGPRKPKPSSSRWRLRRDQEGPASPMEGPP